MSPSLYNPTDPSWKLLLSYLSKHQRQTLREHCFFYVQAKGGKIYGLPSGAYSFVSINKRTGQPKDIYGAFPVEDDEALCYADGLLALLLALTTKPRRLLDLACVNECAYCNPALDSGEYFKGFLKEQARLAKS